MIFEQIGVVVEVLPTRTWMGQSGPGGVASVVIEFYDGQYKKHLVLEHKKNYEQFAQIRPGTNIKARYSVESRKAGERWFTSANCLSWEIVGAPQPQYGYQAPSDQNQPF